MHPQLCEKLLAEQVEATNRSQVRSRLDGDVRREGTRVLAPVQFGERPILIALDGPNYDAEPLQLRLLDGESGAELERGEWPPSLVFGDLHPVLKRPWSCLRGLYEYHIHSSHLDDPWDHHRRSHRVDDMLRLILGKAGL